jgi:hypothetical protein
VSSIFEYKELELFLHWLSLSKLRVKKSFITLAHWQQVKMTRVSFLLSSSLWRAFFRTAIQVKPSRGCPNFEQFHCLWATFWSELSVSEGQ